MTYEKNPFSYYKNIRINENTGALLVDISGTTINTTVDVQLTHSGATPDSVRIGDGNSEWKLNSGTGIVSGTTLIGSEDGYVDIVKGALRTSGTTIIGDENSVVEIKNSGLKISSNSAKPIITLTRQADGNTYSIGDVLNAGGTAMEQFTVLQSADQTSWCIGGRCSHSVSASTQPNLDCHLFSSGFTISADQNLFEPNVNELDHYIGTITFSSFKTFGNRSVSDASTETPIVLKSQDSTNLIIYGVLVMRNAYVGSNAEIFSISLDISQD